MPCPCGCGCAIPHPSLDTACPCGCGDCDTCGSQAETTADETAPDPEPPVAAEDTTTPAPEPAADTTTTREEPAVSEPTTPAVESAPAATAAPATAAPASVTLSAEQFQQLLAMARPAESAPAALAPVAETALAPVAPAAPVQEKSIDQLVQEGITAGIQAMVSSGTLNPGRKGLVRPVNAQAQEGLTDLGIPEDWPQKPLEQYTPEEYRRYVERSWGEDFFGEAFYAADMRRAMRGN